MTGQIYTDIHRYTRIYTDIHGYTRMYTDIHGYIRIYTDIHGYIPVITMGWMPDEFCDRMEIWTWQLRLG